MDSTSAIRALSALAHDSRLQIFRALVREGPMGLSVGEINDTVAIPPTTLSFHLAQLSHAGLVTSKRNGRSIVYAADYAEVKALLDFLMENCCQGAGCVREKGAEHAGDGAEEA